MRRLVHIFLPFVDTYGEANVVEYSLFINTENEEAAKILLWDAYTASLAEVKKHEKKP